jgi:hypothetical protein
VKTLPKTIRTGINLLLLTLLSISANAQKLNSVQENGVWAPINVKIDAKATEWGDTFQAFNKATDIFYTMANDDNNLYIVIKSTNQVNNNKILGGGIDITINTAGKKKEKDAYVIAFPVVDIANLRSQVMQGMRAMRGGGAGGPSGQPQAPDSAAIAAMRKKAVSAAKQIKLLGFAKDVPDTLISIYNEYSIKASADFDNKGSLVIEMAMPLKYLHLSDKTEEFAYNIRLNGIQLNAIFPGASAMMQGGAPGSGGGGGFGGGGGGGGFGGGTPGGGGGGMPRGMADFASMLSPTDFWAKYVLAKNIKVMR